MLVADFIIDLSGSSCLAYKPVLLVGEVTLLTWKDWGFAFKAIVSSPTVCSDKLLTISSSANILKVDKKWIFC